MDGLVTLVDRLRGAAISGDLWVNGSFLSEKIDPADVDLVLRCPDSLYNAGTPDQRAAIDWLIANQKATLRCDSYVFFEYPSHHPLHEEGEWWYAYWHVKFGFTRQPDEDPKGIVVVALSGSTP
jgi:hypothetical protein